MISTKQHLFLPALLSLTALTACGSSETVNITSSGSSITTTTPPVTTPGSAALVNGSFVTTQGTYVTTLPSTNVTLNGQKAWISGDTRANAYEGTNVIAVGGLKDDTPFSGITGTTSAPVISGTSALYSGRYAVNAPTGTQSGNFDMTADFSGGTVSGTTGTFSVSGTITGNDFAGTAQYGSESAELKGGFYGTKDMAGVFSGNAIGGVIYGSTP